MLLYYWITLSSHRCSFYSVRPLDVTKTRRWCQYRLMCNNCHKFSPFFQQITPWIMTMVIFCLDLKQCWAAGTNTQSRNTQAFICPSPLETRQLWSKQEGVTGFHLSSGLLLQLQTNCIFESNTPFDLRSGCTAGRFHLETKKPKYRFITNDN